MSEEKFTPGPWEVAEASDGGIWIMGANRTYPVGTVHGRRDNVGGLNAALVSAAPEMYELLKQLHGALASVPVLQSEIDKILKKARGEE